MALRVEMTGNATGFSRMLETASVQVRAFGASISEEINRSFVRGFKGIGAGFLGWQAFDTLKQTFSWFTETGNQIKDISDQLGMSTDEWQKWADAVDQAHLSTEGLVRVFESLKQKRIEALTDPKARAQLTQLGFTDAEIAGPMSTSDFVKKALANSNNNQWTKQAFDEIAGSLGSRYVRALGHLPGAQADFSPQDLQDAQRLQDFERSVQKNVVERGKLGLMHEMLHPDWWVNFGLQGLLAKAGWSLIKPKTAEPAATHTGMGGGGKTTQSAASGAKTADTNDPLQLVLNQQKQEFALRDQERQQRLMDSERQLMTIGDRHKSILQEMGPLRQQIAQRDAQLQTPEGFLTDAQRQSLSNVTGIARTIQVNEMKEKFLDDTAELRQRLLKDQTDLRQGPLNFQADNLAKVGLYSANALAFNPVLGLHQKTNQLLERIVQNTSKPNIQQPSDPHRP